MGVAKQKKSMEEKELMKLPIVGTQPKSPEEEKYLKEICEFEFYNIENPGMPVQFPYGDAKHRSDFAFEHGGRYRVPRHVARHLESCSTPKYEYRPVDTRGSANMQMKMQPVEVSRIPRFQMRYIFEHSNKGK